MFNHKCFLLFFLLFCFLSSITIEARPIYLYHNCSTAAKNFSTNSTFESHRTTLLSSLASANADFYNTTVHGGGDTIYGLFMCRGDVSLQVCHLCVVNATQRLPSECPFSKEAVIWYHECMLCYSNVSFFTTIDKWSTVAILNLSNISNSDQPKFKRFLLSSRSEGKSQTVHSLGPQLALALASPLSSPSQAPPLAPEPASAPEPAPAPELTPTPASEPASATAPAPAPAHAHALAPELAPAHAPVPRPHPHHVRHRHLGAHIITNAAMCHLQRLPRYLWWDTVTACHSPRRVSPHHNNIPEIVSSPYLKLALS
ncbi:hypothetical protein K1719_016562 [Acacia pycnantha]|nr:hypothetical protein K1719_016562 [Acacia pycnantha]